MEQNAINNHASVVLDNFSTIGRMNIQSLVEQYISKMMFKMNDEVNQGPLKRLVKFFITYSVDDGYAVHYTFQPSFRAVNRRKAYAGYFDQLLFCNEQLLKEISE